MPANCAYFRPRVVVALWPCQLSKLYAIATAALCWAARDDNDGRSKIASAAVQVGWLPDDIRGLRDREPRSNPWVEVLISGECAPQGIGITAESSPALL